MDSAYDETRRHRWISPTTRLFPRCGPVLALGAAVLSLVPVAVPWATAEQEAGVHETTAMDNRRQMHGAAVLGDYLYVFGGVLGNAGVTDTVDKAHILPDGSLGPWSPTTSLPQPRSYIANSTLALNDMIYIVGGLNQGPGNQKYNTVLWTKPLPDGSLSPWMESPPFPGEGLSNLTAVSTPGFLHVLGGMPPNQIPTAAVLSGALDAAGNLVGWEPGPPLPTPLWFHNAVAAAGRVYVWGGQATAKAGAGTVSSSVFSCPILSTGRLGEWREETTRLPVGFLASAGAVAGPFLMSFCPRTDPGGYSSDVWFSSITPSGLAPWQRVTTALPMQRYVAAAPDYRRGTIYIPGGRIDPQERDESVESRVFYFSLSGDARKATEEKLALAQSPQSPAGESDSTAGRTVAATPSAGIGVATNPETQTQFTYLAQDSMEGVSPGFMPYPRARLAVAQPPSRPLILYFNLKGSKPCEQQKQLFTDPTFSPLTQKAVFAWIDDAEWPQLAQQLGIYRSPAWVIYNPQGAECGRHFGVLSPAQLAQGITSCQ